MDDLFLYEIVELASNNKDYRPDPIGDQHDDFVYHDSVVYYAIDSV